jgi:aspartate aminotransferase
MKISERFKKIGGDNKAVARSQMEHFKRIGKNIISLNMGEADFDTPDYIIESAIEAMKAGYTRYTSVEGILELRHALCKKLFDENHVSYLPDEIIVCAGAKQAVSNALFALCDEGDEVLIPTPCWDSYPQMVKLTQAKPVFVEAQAKGSFIPSMSEFKKKITSRTKCIILNNPHNPTGCVYSRDLLEAIGNLACEHNSYIISDEIYEYLTYEGEFISMASISNEIKNRTVTVNGLSKSFAMTGWRVGYAAGAKQIIDAMKIFQGYTTSNVNSISQRAAITALSGSREDVSGMVKEFDLRREFITKELSGMELINFVCPQGTFYVLVNISMFFGRSYQDKKIQNANDFVAFMLEQADILLSSGELYHAPDYVRISYSNSMENLTLAMRKMNDALSLLK